MNRLDSLLGTLARVRAMMPAGSPFPILMAMEIDEMIATALEQQMLLRAVEESLAEAQREHRCPAPKRVTTVPHTVTIEEFRDQKECSICLNRFRHHEQCVVEVKCGHFFHEHCLTPWIEHHDTCPICRADVGD
jgi:hypothetical protein